MHSNTNIEIGDYGYKPNDLLTVGELIKICQDIFNFTGQSYFYHNLRHRFKFSYHSYKIITNEDGQKVKKPTIKRIPYQRAIETIKKLKKNPEWIEN